MAEKTIPDSDDLTAIPLGRIIREVRACVDENLSVAGLALALTIPDILGGQCFPELVYEDGDRKVGAQYCRWFDKWVSRYFVDSVHWFTGEMCYALRCDILHAMRSDIEYHHSEKQGVRYRYRFELVDDGSQVHSEHDLEGGRVRECVVHVNADELASAICDGAESCLNAMGLSGGGVTRSR